MSDIESRFPKHKCRLSLEHNPHRNCYDPIEQWDVDNTGGDNPWCDWVSEEQRLKAISQDNVWTLQWHPETPIGFHALAACDLDVLLKAAEDID